MNATDLAETHSLEIDVAQGVRILDYSLCITTEKSNQVSIEALSPSKLKVSFDYLNANDGIAILVIHSGSKGDLGVDGKIKGGLPIKCINYNNPFSEKEKTFLDKMTKKKWFFILYNLSFHLFFILLFFGILSALLSELNIIETSSNNGFIYYPSSPTLRIIYLVLFLILVSLSYVVACVRVHYLKRNNLPSMPKDLEEFFNPFL